MGQGPACLACIAAARASTHGCTAGCRGRGRGCGCGGGGSAPLSCVNRRCRAPLVPVQESDGGICLDWGLLPGLMQLAAVRAQAAT